MALAGVHHFKLPSSDIDRTVAFYTTHLPLTHLPELNHVEASTGSVYAKILRHTPSQTTLEIRNAPEQAARERGWDPITWAVQGYSDLVRWREHFISAGVRHTAVYKGVTGWGLTAEDPDGRLVRFYTLEEHGITADLDPAVSTKFE
ncbi:Glyoxalase/Bleomycin resistance protein/Dihydroxybiphenyl dioxygenase [Cryphonectria parasitica EP155]|uniref:Glyoxalase/Bleomycin resistance protein/Dihydroxybiphenyl dioxygenase n=1 Tax=Cryphonectria parasitica (strain ATCC 38755 / EP155) TaxID=660469 RepID=A0A9P4XW83_CRYP1|nr:Glyoxalase/Bleomycin resistance protein/Dihydroxybiphenyl dioxygenase [Cryphonectria parasitica EP155]KAF3762148.1 Glyoxalase/Bleomycin resistance protein/Dihydroxybiphenyl dioxygenase [Cryphonectria parasitica EP155]